MYSGTCTGAGFSSETVGFLCFRYWNDKGPEIARTTDGGKSWARMTLEVPPDLRGRSFTPYSPVFDGAHGVMNVQMYEEAVPCGIAQLVTEDGGMTWTWVLPD